MLMHAILTLYVAGPNLKYRCDGRRVHACEFRSVVIAHGGCTDTIRESALEADSREEENKIK